MSQRPSGTVTFLFTDIEGSTQLLAKLGERYIILLDEHNRILHEVFSTFHGHEEGNEGDSFFVAFGRASEAIAAACQIQQELAQQKWPEDVKVRVRMGLHTGEPWTSEKGYRGIDVHRAARIAHVGHGGQVLLSATTSPLVQDDLPKGTTLRDLGRHQLKDMANPERIHQLVIPGLPDKFPPLTSLKALDPEKDRLLDEIDDQTLLKIMLGDNDPAVRTEAALAYALRGDQEKVKIALLDQVEQGVYTAFGALVALVDEYGMPKVDSTSLRLQIHLELIKKRWRKYRNRVWIQTRKAAFGGGLLIIYGAAVPLVMRLTSIEIFNYTLTYMPLSAYYLISIILFGVYGFIQGAALGFAVGLGDALFSGKHRTRWRALFGAIAGVISALFFSATQLLSQEPVSADSSLVIVTNLTYGLLMGLILTSLIPPFHSVKKIRNRAVQIIGSMLLLALLSIPYIMIIYKFDYQEALLSRILLALLMPITFTLPFILSEKNSESEMINAA